MNNTPTIYIPVEAENNGITIPVLLSMLVHGAVIGFILYTNHSPNIEPSPSIETSLVTPGELADIQGQILANQEALAAAAQGGSQTATQDTTDRPSDTTQSTVRQTRERVAVFTRSDNPPDSNESQNSYSYADHVRQRQLEYEQQMAEFAQQLDNEIAAEHEAQRDQATQAAIDEQQRLEEYRKSASQPIITRPSNNTNESENDSSRTNNPTTLSIGRDGVSSSSNSNSSSGSTSSGGAPSAGVKNNIIAAIQKHFHPPVESQNKTAVLTLNVSSDGRVTSVFASGDDPRVNAAAERAANAASPLPIDKSNPEAYATLRVTIRGE